MDTALDLQIRIAAKKLRQTLASRDLESAFDKEAFQELGRAGFFKLPISEAAHAFHILGQVSQDIPFGVSCVAQFIAVELLLRFGSQDQQLRYLEPLMSGAMIAAICNSEAGAGTNIRAIKSSAHVSGTDIMLNIDKRGATNLSKADLLFCSVWKHSQGQKPALEVMITEGRHAEQSSFNKNLAGFRTGLTGSAVVRNRVEKTESAQLGRDLSGYMILRHCFNLERLLIASLVGGTLEGACIEATHQVLKAQSFGKPLAEYQYVQEKIVQVYGSGARLQYMIAGILNSKPNLVPDDLVKQTKQLALLKLATVDEGAAGFNAYFEVCGFGGYTQSSPAQKLSRDHMALRMLGGTKEQQKILLFNEIVEETRVANQVQEDIKKLMEERKVSDGETKSTQVS